MIPQIQISNSSFSTSPRAFVCCLLCLVLIACDCLSNSYVSLGEFTGKHNFAFQKTVSYFTWQPDHSCTMSLYLHQPLLVCSILFLCSFFWFLCLFFGVL